MIYSVTPNTYGSSPFVSIDLEISCQAMESMPIKGFAHLTPAVEHLLHLTCASFDPGMLDAFLEELRGLRNGNLWVVDHAGDDL